MYAIRCKGSARGFRRAGQHFDYERWTLVEHRTQELMDEPMLVIVSNVKSVDDPRLAPFHAFTNPEALEEDVTPDEPPTPPKTHVPETPHKAAGKAHKSEPPSARKAHKTAPPPVARPAESSDDPDSIAADNWSYEPPQTPTEPDSENAPPYDKTYQQSPDA